MWAVQQSGATEAAVRLPTSPCGEMKGPRTYRQTRRRNADCSVGLVSVGSCLNTWPHRSKLCIRNDRRHLEFDAEALDPGREMGPNLAEVTCYSDGHSSASDGITDAVLQLKAFKVVARCPCTDVFGKGRTGVPGAFNRGEVPDDQIVLHNGQSKPFSHSSNKTSPGSRLIQSCVVRISWRFAWRAKPMRSAA